MKVVKENIDDLNALLTVTVEKKDYQEKVDKALNDYRKKANIPGFRKGMVPMGMIKKQYGKSLLADELNRLVGESLYKYIEDEKLDILGNPLPKNDIEVKGDFDNPDNFEFVYEIGMAPKLDIKLTAKNKYPYTKVKVDKKLIDQQIEDLTRRYGKLVSSETVGEKDMIMGQFVELTDKGEIKEGGVMNNSTVTMEFIDKKAQKELLGKKVGDKIVIDPMLMARDNHDAHHMLNIPESDIPNISKKFQFTINEVKVMQPAEMNQDLFDKLFGKDQITSEKDLRDKLKEDLTKMFEKDSERILVRRISADLLKKTDVQLPNEFLKRWIIASQETPITMEEVNSDYENYTRSLKWQLIQNNIFKANEIKIGHEEAIHYTKGLLANQYAQYGMPIPEDKELAHSAHHVLENQKEAQQIYDMIGEDKLINFFKETVKLDENEVDYEEFVKIAQDKEA
ncbi:MAG: trigger factor [Brumimicrobium sp.]|nr:trigger factor [Brumimicrobium sp.]